MSDKKHELVSNLKKLASDLERTPTSREFNQSGNSWRQVRNHFGTYNELVKAAGLEPNESPQTTKSNIVAPPRILIFDIEVCAGKAYTYNYRDAYISPDQVISQPYVLSFAAKWLGDDRMFYFDTRYSSRDDKQVLEALHYLLSKASCVVGHNMKVYDYKTIKGRMLLHDMEPIHTHTIWDTFKIALKHFKFPFYKLGVLAEYLKLDVQKSSHAKFPGNSLFIEADKGNMEAFEEMEDYCKKDVLVTEQVFLKLMKWEPNINIGIFEQKRICICGSIEFKKEGFHYLKNSVKQRYRCANPKCGKMFTDKENLVDKDIRKHLLN